MADDPVFDEGSSFDAETRLYAEIWNRIDSDDSIDVTTREVLDPIRLECTDALSEHPPNRRKLAKLTSIALTVLELRPDS